MLAQHRDALIYMLTLLVIKKNANYKTSPRAEEGTMEKGIGSEGRWFARLNLELQRFCRGGLPRRCSRRARPMGLSGRKDKQRIGADPRNLSWVDSTMDFRSSPPFGIELSFLSDAAKFGQSYLSKLGWDSSKGLGANGDGMTSHIKVAQKLNLLGIGAGAPQGPEAIAWKQNRDYEILLARLNAQNAGAVSDQQETVEVEETVVEATGNGGGAVVDIAGEDAERKRKKDKKKKRKLEEDADAKKEKKRRKTQSGSGDDTKEKSKKDKKDKKSKKRLDDTEAGVPSQTAPEEPDIPPVVAFTPRPKA